MLLTDIVSFGSWPIIILIDLIKLCIENQSIGSFRSSNIVLRYMYTSGAQPSECGRQRTLNIVHAQTAAQQQSNGSYEARMSGKCGEWRD